jgi:hypothetical protein
MTHPPDPPYPGSYRYLIKHVDRLLRSRYNLDYSASLYRKDDLNRMLGNRIPRVSEVLPRQRKLTPNRIDPPLTRRSSLRRSGLGSTNVVGSNGVTDVGVGIGAGGVSGEVVLWSSTASSVGNYGGMSSSVGSVVDVLDVAASSVGNYGGMSSTVGSVVDVLDVAASSVGNYGGISSSVGSVVDVLGVAASSVENYGDMSSSWGSVDREMSASNSMGNYGGMSSSWGSAVVVDREISASNSMGSDGFGLDVDRM